jgi:transposase
MVKMNIYVQIQQLKRQRFKKMQIANKLNIDVKTVRKYYDMNEKAYADYVLQCRERYRSMTKYDYFLTGKLQEHPDVTSSQLYDWLREAYKDFKVSYSSVRLHIKRLREREGIPKPSDIRQYGSVEDLPFGYQAQVDMGSAWLINIYGKRIKVYVFCMSMSNSRHKYAFFQTKPFTSETFIEAHDLAFKFFGGRTKEIVYDQDRIMTVSENYGNLLLVDKFLAYKNYCGFSIYLCRGADPESKGKIESVVKYVKNNFLKHREFSTIDNLNNQALEWLDRTGNGLIHNTTKLIPKIVFKEEQKYLTAVPSIEKQYCKPATYLVRKDNVVSYRSNRYAVPKRTYAPGKYVIVEEKDENLIISDFNGELIVKHNICRERGKLITISHSERERNTKLELMFNQAHELLGGNTDANDYLKRIAEIFPRYQRDQLGLIKKACVGFSKSEIQKALNYCIEKEIYSANEFRDTLLYFKSEQPKITGFKGELPLEYASVKIPAREIKCYASIYGGNK